MKIENNEDTIKIIGRFFEAIDHLRDDKIIGGLKTITERYGMNRWNTITMRKDASLCGAFRSAWLAYLVRDYKISPFWLLLGEGDFYQTGFNAEIVKKLQINCKTHKTQA